MENFQDKVAFITGGASGIGLGMAKAFLAAGMKVAIADIRQEALDKTSKLLGGGARVRAIRLDVTDRKDWAKAADEAARAFGKVHVLCSNAGVFFMGPAYEATYQDWDFCLGVNLGGTVNAVKTMVPRIIGHGEGGHIVITASINGLFTNAGVGVYTTSKFALTGLGEALRADLSPHRIGVSVLCPGAVASGLFESTPVVRPKALAETAARLVSTGADDPVSARIFAAAMPTDEVGRRVLAGIKRNDLYILTHAEIRSVLESRANALIAAVPDEKIDAQRLEASRVLLDDSIYREQAAKSAPTFP
jgi:NAD(P)-dependent dehydrogenase (short-subunit alcohol dehydrogenase family)